MKMDFDIDIIKEFIPIEDKSSFLVFESINVRGDIIYAPYRTLLDTERMANDDEQTELPFFRPIPLSSYLSRKREKKINEIINPI